MSLLLQPNTSPHMSLGQVRLDRASRDHLRAGLDELSSSICKRFVKPLQSIFAILVCDQSRGPEGARDISLKLVLQRRPLVGRVIAVRGQARKTGKDMVVVNEHDGQLLLQVFIRESPNAMRL